MCSHDSSLLFLLYSLTCLQSSTSLIVQDKLGKFCVVTTYRTDFHFDIYFCRGWDILLINNNVFWWKAGPFPIIRVQYAAVQNCKHLIFNRTCDEYFSLFHFLWKMGARIVTLVIFMPAQHSLLENQVKFLSIFQFDLLRQHSISFKKNMTYIQLYFV